MHKTVVINAVGLTQPLAARLSSLKKFASPATIGHVLPAVTCSVQATYLTGKLPREHGIVGNGWYFRDECEIKFWRQSDKLVQQPRIWDLARKVDSSFTCANLFWWNAMYSSCDVTVTPRPMYPADGRKLPDVWTNPANLRFELQEKLGQFPLFKFWGPAASIESTKWIADAAIEVDKKFDPTLSLIYLPHLDYCLQKFGDAHRELDELDRVLAHLLEHFQNSRIIILSEYGIEPVNRPIHLNRLLRTQNLVAIREEQGLELLDAGASSAFVVADHQVAHVYVNDPSKLDLVRQIIRSTPGVQQVLDRADSIDHPRSGELIAIAESGSWFTYYYWLDDAKAPDFARTVDIHRKPGYDPAELFIDPKIRWPKLTIGKKLFSRKLGFRNLLDVIPLDANLVRGSHGRSPIDDTFAPVFLSSQPGLVDLKRINAIDVCDSILRHVFTTK